MTHFASTIAVRDNLVNHYYAAVSSVAEIRFYGTEMISEGAFDRCFELVYAKITVILRGF